MEIKEQLKNLRESALNRIQTARSVTELADLEVKYLGRKSAITDLLRRLTTLSAAERARVGKVANELKGLLSRELAKKRGQLLTASYADLAEREAIDVTEPGSAGKLGRLHPLTQVTYEVVDIFAQLGFSVFEGPEIESDYYNFQALNIPKGHPARDTQDTFYLSADEELLLRTHTSPGQIRAMEQMKPPLRVVVPGRVYRRDSDPTHSPMFNQVEGLLVDDTTNFAELKGTLTAFVKAFFGERRLVRFRPHHFPFTEPSAEMDVSCGVCNGTGQAGGKSCRGCKGTGWLEIMGAGSVHPNVLRYGGIDPERFRGFAFGMGIDRLAMLKWDIDNIDYLFSNDIRVLRQF